METIAWFRVSDFRVLLECKGMQKHGRENANYYIILRLRFSGLLEA